jgi:crotonobetainyl-CoA:carnitine CoA-transferase CaiB-like acyl-CoA transferase
MTESSTAPAHSPYGGRAGPLAGLTVVDFTRQIAGPYATMLLGDLGADVIKIEAPGTGDDSRRLQPNKEDIGSVFLTMNRNKRSIELDLKSDEGRRIASDLIARADILVENFTAGVMDRFGFDYETLSQQYPALIYCSVTGFGQRGKFAGRPGFDPVIQADCGLFSVNGYADTPPVRIAAPVIDVATGLTTLNAIQAALIHRYRTGEGQKVEVALYDVGTALLAYFPVVYMWTGADQQRTGNRSQVGSPADLFPTSDGAFFMSCSTDRMYNAMVNDVLDRPDLGTDPRFHTNGERLKRNEELLPILNDIFRTKPRDYWVARLLKAGVPAGPVRSISEAVESEEAVDRGLFSYVQHPSMGPLPNVAAPFRLEGSPLVAPRPVPRLGEHSIEVLSDVLGYSAEKIANLGYVEKHFAPFAGETA